MKAARGGGNPDFARYAVAVDDDLAAILEFDLENAISRRFKIEIGLFQRLFDMSQGLTGGQVEFGFA